MQPHQSLWTRPWYFFGDIMCAAHRSDSRASEELATALVQFAEREGLEALRDALVPAGGGASRLPAFVRNLPSVRSRVAECYPWDASWDKGLPVAFADFGAGLTEYLLRPERLVLPWPLEYPGTADGARLEELVEELGVQPPRAEYDERQDLHLGAALAAGDLLVRNRPGSLPPAERGDAWDALRRAAEEGSFSYLRLPAGASARYDRSVPTDRTEVAAHDGKLELRFGVGKEDCPARGSSQKAMTYRHWPCGAFDPAA